MFIKAVLGAIAYTIACNTDNGDVKHQMAASIAGYCLLDNILTIVGPKEKDAA